jgi:hypothetical protein
MKIAHLLPVLLTAFPFSTSAETQNGHYGPSAGMKEFTIAGTGSNDNDFDHGAWGLTASYGWFATDNLEWVIRQSFSYADLAGDNAGSGSTRIGADYHFNMGKLRPFIGANIGAIYGDAVNNTGIAGPELGLKYYVKPETFLYVQTEYQFFFDSADDVDENFDDGAYAHSVGVGFNF